jgi:hypothetical protein
MTVRWRFNLDWKRDAQGNAIWTLADWRRKAPPAQDGYQVALDMVEPWQAPPVVGAAVESSTTSSTDAAYSKRAQGPAGTRDDGRTARATKTGSTAAPISVKNDR